MRGKIEHYGMMIMRSYNPEGGATKGKESGEYIDSESSGGKAALVRRVQMLERQIKERERSNRSLA